MHWHFVTGSSFHSSRVGVQKMSSLLKRRSFTGHYSSESAPIHAQGATDVWRTFTSCGWHAFHADFFRRAFVDKFDKAVLLQPTAAQLCFACVWSQCRTQWHLLVQIFHPWPAALRYMSDNTSVQLHVLEINVQWGLHLHRRNGICTVTHHSLFESDTNELRLPTFLLCASGDESAPPGLEGHCYKMRPEMRFITTSLITQWRKKRLKIPKTFTGSV